MDYQFPHQLFPSFYNLGPPDSVLTNSTGSWGCYDQVRPLGGSGRLSSWSFTSRHHVRGETWRHTEPVPVPLLSPKHSFLWHLTPPDPLDFTKHMQNFFLDHCHDAFGGMGEILGEYFNFKQGKKERYRRDSIHMWKMKNIIDMLNLNKCQQTYSSKSLEAYSSLLLDVIPSIPPGLLGSLLHEELSEQRDSLLFSETATGGALAFISFPQTGTNSEHGCLLYPGNQGFDHLNFHKVVMQHDEGNSAFLDAKRGTSFIHQLKGPIRQISPTSLFNECCIAVRSDHLCGVWRFSERNEPRLLQVVKTKEIATCISISPHILGEVLLTSESGAANLWIIGKGMQKVREESSNLYFNVKSPWRWCEFSAHPRVIVYADRTGAELTDIRANPVSGHTLFRISNTSECRTGERLVLAKYMGDIHPFHHLITTQYSAYIVDERFPCMPMLKWDHMMESPPIFCHIIPGSSSSASMLGQCSTAKVLLGSRSSQEMILLQYSGGRAEHCFSQGPPQALLQPRNSLKHLPVQIPHRLTTATNRLSSPAAGMTCIQEKKGGDVCLCVLQLTEAGDIFYQVLEPEQPNTTSQPQAAEDEPLPSQETKKSSQLPGPELVESETSSDIDVIGPTQGVARQRRQLPVTIFSDSSSEGSESKRRRQNLKHRLHVVNVDPELDQVSGSDAEENIIKMCGDAAGKETGVVDETACGSRRLNHVGTFVQQTPVKLSKHAHVTWKHWLQKLMQKCCKKKPHPHCLQHITVNTSGLLHLPDGEARDSTEEEHVQSLRQDLSVCMSKRLLHVHSSASTSLMAPHVLPVPNQVDTDVWRDWLSQRLTLSWNGKEAWQAWWEDHLGLNREKKVDALKRKRKREKEAKRATGQRLELSGSFTSSVTYQSQLDDFSDSTGWCSAASKYSDTEETEPLSQPDPFLQTPRAMTPSTVYNDTPDPTPSAKHQSAKFQQGDPRTPSSSRSPFPSHTVKCGSTLASQRKDRCPADDYLSSMFSAQNETSQHSYFPEEESTMYTPTPTAASSSFMSQLCSPQSAPLRSLWLDLAHDSYCWSGFSQSSQVRPRLSQASQSSHPKKSKKSQMGF